MSDTICWLRSYCYILWCPFYLLTSYIFKYYFLMCVLQEVQQRYYAVVLSGTGWWVQNVGPRGIAENTWPTPVGPALGCSPLRRDVHYTPGSPLPHHKTGRTNICHHRNLQAIRILKKKKKKPSFLILSHKRQWETPTPHR